MDNADILGAISVISVLWSYDAQTDVFVIFSIPENGSKFHNKLFVILQKMRRNALRLARGFCSEGGSR